jgi:hypothetical protein
MMLGNGLRPPVLSSVAPIGIPARPTPEPDARPGEDADAAEFAKPALPVEQVPDAVPPDMPAPSNSAVGAEVAAPVAVAVPVMAPEIPAVCISVPDAACPDPKHVVVVMDEPASGDPPVVGLTPGVASSVAPNGIPVVPTGAPGPMPSGEVTPSGMPVPMVAWAKAGPQPSKADAIVTSSKRFMDASGALS